MISPPSGLPSSNFSSQSLASSALSLAFRHLLRVVGVLVAIPLSLLGLLALFSGATWSGVSYSLSLLVVCYGLLTAPSRATRRRGVTRAGVAWLVLTALLRLATAARGETAEMTAGVSSSPRLVDRVLDEEDVAVSGARALVATGLLTDPDVRELVPQMKSAYRRMHAEQGDLPSPVVATYLGLQSPDASDKLAFDVPRRSVERTGAVVFLHGYAGGFTLPCWQIARVAARLGLATVCPSVGYRGDWWTADGERTVRATVDALHARGIHRVWLAGLSNGGIGASRLAPRMGHLFEGMILVSGAAPEAPRTSLPTLVLQGRADSMMPTDVARSYGAGAQSRYVELDAGHFAMLIRSEVADHAIESWLRQQLARSVRQKREVDVGADRREAGRVDHATL